MNKFKLKNAPKEKEKENEDILQQLASAVSPIFADVAPDSYNNMTAFETLAKDCRIGTNSNGKPFSGVTAVSDFCAHAHRDHNNLEGGCTVVLTLTKPENRQIGGTFFQ